jgi:uncharacterized protein YifE (UPF0438 family)
MFTPPTDAAQRAFVFGCSTAVFPSDELEALTEYGNRMEALVAGEIQPATSEEAHFLKVDRGGAEPETVLERAWLRLKGRREFERDQAAPPAPPVKAQDYGMIEFDKDRCWW